MKRIIGFLFMTSQALTLLSQTDKGEIFIEFAGGTSLVSGNFIKSDYKDLSAGFAKSLGVNFQLSTGYLIRKNFSIDLAIGGSSYQLHDLKNIVDGYNDDFDVDSTTLTAKGSYRLLNFLIGPSYSISIKKITLDGHVLMGLSSLKIPEFKVDLEDNQSSTFYQRSSSGSGFAVQSGIGATYAIFNNIGLSLTSDYLFAKPKVFIQNENRINNAGRYLNQYQESVGGISLKLGLRFIF
jgi:hypothetical protein